MYKVYFWNRCPITGDFLDSCLFDTMRAARKFARQHGAQVSHVLPR